MFETIFAILDDWIDDQNREARREGLREIQSCEFKILGQIALMEAATDLHIGMTKDFDAVSNAPYAVMRKLDELLGANGFQYDLLSSEIWMPDETTYVELLKGKWVTALRAELLYVMISKARMAVVKNRILLRQYLASKPPRQFFDLCLKYGISLEEILKD